jgi:hypothetical protein
MARIICWGDLHLFAERGEVHLIGVTGMGLSGSKSLPAESGPGGLPADQWAGERLRRLAAHAKRGAIVGARLAAGLTLLEVVFARPWNTHGNAAAPYCLFLLIVNVAIGFYAGAALGPVSVFINRKHTDSLRSWLAAYILIGAVIGAGVGAVVGIKAADEASLRLVADEKHYVLRLARMLLVPAVCGTAAGVPVGLLLGMLRHLMARRVRRQADGPARDD